jgi:hypothetical protein
MRITVNNIFWQWDDWLEAFLLFGETFSKCGFRGVLPGSFASSTIRLPAHATETVKSGLAYRVPLVQVIDVFYITRELFVIL